MPRSQARRRKPGRAAGVGATPDNVGGLNRRALPVNHRANGLGHDRQLLCRFVFAGSALRHAGPRATMTVMSACSPIAETGGVGSSGRTDRALNRAGKFRSEKYPNRTAACPWIPDNWRG